MLIYISWMLIFQLSDIMRINLYKQAQMAIFDVQPRYYEEA